MELGVGLWGGAEVEVGVGLWGGAGALSWDWGCSCGCGTRTVAVGWVGVLRLWGGATLLGGAGPGPVGWAWG